MDIRSSRHRAMPESRNRKRVQSVGGRLTVDPAGRGRGNLRAPVCRPHLVGEIRHHGLRWRQNSAKFRFIDSGS